MHHHHAQIKKKSSFFFHQIKIVRRVRIDLVSIFLYVVISHASLCSIDPFYSYWCDDSDEVERCERDKKKPFNKLESPFLQRFDSILFFLSAYEWTHKFNEQHYQMSNHQILKTIYDFFSHKYRCCLKNRRMSYNRKCARFHWN